MEEEINGGNSQEVQLENKSSLKFWIIGLVLLLIIAGIAFIIWKLTNPTLVNCGAGEYNPQQDACMFNQNYTEQRLVIKCPSGFNLNEEQETCEKIVESIYVCNVSDGIYDSSTGKCIVSVQNTNYVCQTGTYDSSTGECIVIVENIVYACTEGTIQEINGTNFCVVSLTVIREKMGYCGDGVCQDLETNMKFCPEDCNAISVDINGMNSIVVSEVKVIDGSPFGVLASGGTYSDFASLIDDIGIKSIRYGGMQGVDYWALNKPENMPPGYPPEFIGWGNLDRLYKETYNVGKEMSVIITSDEVPTEFPNGTLGLKGYRDFIPTGTNLSLKEYSDFVKFTVERYDGDGINDAEGSPVVTYWEIDNEPDIIIEYESYFLWKGNLSLTDEYALMLKTAYKTIKSENPNAKVAIGAACTNLDYFEQIIKELENLSDHSGEKFFDVFNFHVYGDFREYGRETFPKEGRPLSLTMTQVKELLAKYGYSGIELIVTESGTDSGGGEQGQTQSEQAASLLKRYVYLLSEGVDRIYWYILDKDVSNGPLDPPNQALVTTNNGEKDIKLAYYTYKLMVDKLEGSDWNNVQEIYNSDNVYAYKLIKSGKPIYVLWWDYFDDPTYSNGDTKTISLSDLGISGEVKVTETVPKYQSGTEVSDYNLAFNTLTTSELITLGEIPVYVEVANLTPTGDQTFQGKCGDGICQDIEKSGGQCPADCG